MLVHAVQNDVRTSSEQLVSSETKQRLVRLANVAYKRQGTSSLGDYDRSVLADSLALLRCRSALSGEETELVVLDDYGMDFSAVMDLVFADPIAALERLSHGTTDDAELHIFNSLPWWSANSGVR